MSYKLFTEQDAINMMGVQTSLYKMGKSNLYDVTGCKINTGGVCFDKNTFYKYEKKIWRDWYTNDMNEFGKLLADYPNFWIAGSSISNTMRDVNCGFGDIDIFIVAREGEFCMKRKDSNTYMCAELDLMIQKFMALVGAQSVKHSRFSVSFRASATSIYREIQIIKRIYRDPSEIINRFDIIPSMFITDGKRRYTNACGLMFMKCGVFPINNQTMKYGTKNRIIKYVGRYGFTAYMPGAKTKHHTLFDDRYSESSRKMHKLVKRSKETYGSCVSHFEKLADINNYLKKKYGKVYDQFVKSLSVGYEYVLDFNSRIDISYERLFDQVFTRYHEYNGYVKKNYSRLMVPQFWFPRKTWSKIAMIFYTKTKEGELKRIMNRWLVRKILMYML
jgi:hypothetical protein